VCARERERERERKRERERERERFKFRDLLVQRNEKTPMQQLKIKFFLNRETRRVEEIQKERKEM
jgi:hypothetical protein